MEIEREVKKMTLGHEFGAGASCLKCKDKCEGFELHFWRKICRNCKCGLTEHDVSMNSEENKKVGKLFEDTKYTGLIAKLKTDGVPRYQAKMVTISLPSVSSRAYSVPPSAASIVPPTAANSAPPPAGSLVPPPAGSLVPPPAGSSGSVQPAGAPTASATHVASASITIRPGAPVKANKVAPAAGVASANAEPVQKDVPMQSVTLEWAPPVEKKLAALYIQLLPPERRPVAGTQGAAYRRQQMARQLPEHDQDPSKCHELSPAEVKKMQQFVRKYKDEALGVGDVMLPEDMALVLAGRQGAGGPGGARGAGGPWGVLSDSNPPRRPPQACHHCGKAMRRGEPAVYAERAGYDKLWHPACFVCCKCGELLVDMIYFFKKGKMYCGRHYGDSEKPRCGGCDELIFSNEYTQAEGQNWHLKHFCCFDCDCILAGETYVMEADKPVCQPCYMKNHAVKCSSCQAAVEPEAQRVSYGEHHWHAAPQCFKCSGCSKCLMGERFMAVQSFLFCSVECKKKTMA
ncbi:testin [Salarias fasciatus]|uniref:testin n=1 Tax=Salarias fasciatus TaxID=181472 RepID=UPI00117676A6|nr:testin [Salarias fasciatus]